MLAVVFEAGDTVGQTQFYIDGSFVSYSCAGTRAINTATNATTGNIGTIVLGGTQTTDSGGSEAFDGQIDQVRVYNTALNETQLDAIYSIPEPQTYALMVGVAMAGLALLRRRR